MRHDAWVGCNRKGMGDVNDLEDFPPGWKKPNIIQVGTIDKVWHLIKKEQFDGLLGLYRLPAPMTLPIKATKCSAGLIAPELLAQIMRRIVGGSFLVRSDP
jgi:hypothetical protein